MRKKTLTEEEFLLLNDMKDSLSFTYIEKHINKNELELCIDVAKSLGYEVCNGVSLLNKFGCHVKIVNNDNLHNLFMFKLNGIDQLPEIKPLFQFQLSNLYFVLEFLLNKGITFSLNQGGLCTTNLGLKFRGSTFNIATESALHALVIAYLSYFDVDKTISPFYKEG